MASNSDRLGSVSAFIFLSTNFTGESINSRKSVTDTLFNSGAAGKGEIVPLTICHLTASCSPWALESHDDDGNLGNRFGSTRLWQHQSTWQKPIAINILPRNDVLDLGRIFGRIQAPRPTKRLWRLDALTVKTQTLECYRGRGFQISRLGIKFSFMPNTIRSGAGSRRLKPSHHLHTVIFSIWCQNQLIQFLKEQLQHFSSRQQPSRSSEPGTDRAPYAAFAASSKSSLVRSGRF